MKAVFVAKIDKSNLYYILDSESPLSDGVVVPEGAEPTVVSFWDTVRFAIGLRKSMETEFHRYLWSTPDKDEMERWYRIFVRKNQKIKDSMLNGVQIRSDIMKSGKKQKGLYEKAVSFRVELSSPVNSSAENKEV